MGEHKFNKAVKQLGGEPEKNKRLTLQERWKLDSETAYEDGLAWAKQREKDKGKTNAWRSNSK